MITYFPMTCEIKQRITESFSAVVVRHLHPEEDGGFTYVALHGLRPVGVISSYLQHLPAPLPQTREAYIDVIEVLPEYRERGIARAFITLTLEEAKIKGAYQLRAWSSEDKTEAIPMWKALGFALSPATIYPRGQEVKGYFVSKVL